MLAQVLIADPIRLYRCPEGARINNSVPASPEKKICAIFSCAWNLGTNVMRTDDLLPISAMLGGSNWWAARCGVEQLGDRDCAL